jgi:hypothetical protein
VRAGRGWNWAKAEPGRRLMSSRSILFWVTAIAIIGLVRLAMTFGPELSRRLGTKDVPQNGILATARITEIKDTGSRVNYNPRVHIKMEVQPTSGAAFAAETETVVSVVDLPRLQPGATVSVRYDPGDRTAVSLVLE